MHVETVNKKLYDTVRVQEFIFLPPELVETFNQLNTFYANHVESDDMTITFSIIYEELNRTAEYLARYGRDNISSFVEASNIFGNLQYFHDRDMGLAFSYPEMKFLPNLGDGEVIDGTTPVTEAMNSAANSPITEDTMELDLQYFEHELIYQERSNQRGVNLEVDQQLEAG